LGNSADEISRQIAATRDGIEDKIITLRGRSEVAIRRSKRTLVIAAGIGAAAAVGILGAIAIYRFTRPTSNRERLQRLVPPTWWQRALHLRQSWELGLRKQVPPMRLYIGDKQIGEEPPANTMQKIGLRIAQAAGTAIGGALVQRVMQSMSSKDPAA